MCATVSPPLHSLDTSSYRFTPTVSQVVDASKTTRPTSYDTWLKCWLKPSPGWHHLPAWSCSKKDGQQLRNKKSLHLETEEKAPPQGQNAPVLLSSDLTWLIYWAEEDFHTHTTPEELWRRELTLGKGQQKFIKYLQTDNTHLHSNEDKGKGLAWQLTATMAWKGVVSHGKIPLTDSCFCLRAEGFSVSVEQAPSCQGRVCQGVQVDAA